MYASKVFQSIRFSTSRLSTAVCSALTGRRVCMMGWTVGKPKLKPWPRRKRCCQAGFEFFDHTRCRGLCRYCDLLDLKVHVWIPALEDGAQVPVECPHSSL